MHFEKNLPATQTRSYLRVWTGLKTNKGLYWRAAGELPASRAQLRDRRRVGIAEAVELGGVEELGNHGSGRNILPQSGQAHRSFHVLLNQCPLMLMLMPVLLGAHRGFGHYTWSSPTPDILTGSTAWRLRLLLLLSSDMSLSFPNWSQTHP